MPRSTRHVLLTDRDQELLAVLARGPHDKQQLLRISQRFATPFTSERYLRKRLQTLRDAGWVGSWPYATTGQGALLYYKLTRIGFRLLHGDTPLPPRSFFSLVPHAAQPHTRFLTDFVVHADVAAWRAGVQLTDYYADKALRLDIDGQSLYPDSAFQLLGRDGKGFKFFVELDNGTERVRTQKDVESLERKLRLYDLHRDRSQAFRVLFVTTRTDARLEHLLSTARQVVRNPQRPLFYGITLEAFLRQPCALSFPIFRSHQGDFVTAIPPDATWPDVRPSAVSRDVGDTRVVRWSSCRKALRRPSVDRQAAAEKPLSVATEPRDEPTRGVWQTPSGARGTGHPLSMQPIT